MTKYKEYYNEMVKQNKDVFESFKVIHDEYARDPKKWQDQFNSQGEKVVEIIRDYERRLCSHSEGGQFGKFSGNLADKFWGEVKKYLPKIEFVGVKYS